MKYLHRDIEPFLRKAIQQFPVIAVTGPRQSGKSTTLQKLFRNHTYFTLDDPVVRRQAKDDPGLFIDKVPPFSILDEIQYVPQILPYIKIRVDQNRDMAGQFLLTGSQIFQLMAGMTESLAGRVALFELLPFSLGELSMDRKTTLPDLFSLLYRGFFPEPAAQGVNTDMFFPSYMQTYLERDIRQISNVQDLSLFQKFVELLAGRFELYFYRDSNKNEIDLIIDRAGKVDLIEIKMRINLNYDDVKTLKKIDIRNKQNNRWIVSCLEHQLIIEKIAQNVPWWDVIKTIRI